MVTKWETVMLNEISQSVIEGQILHDFSMIRHPKYSVTEIDNKMVVTRGWLRGIQGVVVQ